jgi:hypothetical protein
LRNRWRNNAVFRGDWWRRHPRAWIWPGLGVGLGAWAWTSWNSFYPWFGINAAPISLVYGDNIYFDGGSVFVNGQFVPAQQYFAQLQTSVMQGVNYTPQGDDWRSLGVFALAADDSDASDQVVQLAVHKSGAVRGNFYDQSTQTSLTVEGWLDRTSQRLTFTIGDDHNTIYEVGVFNLTQGEAPVLVHFGPTQNATFTWGRLDAPAGMAGASAYPP